MGLSEMKSQPALVWSRIGLFPQETVGWELLCGSVEVSDSHADGSSPSDWLLWADLSPTIQYGLAFQAQH